MLRNFIIWLSRAKWAQRIVTRSGIGRRISRRFVAGETQAEALQAVRTLNEHGIFASLDYLGENTTNPAEASEAAGIILDLLEAVDSSGVKSGVSIKLSQIGMALDRDLCCQHLTRILEMARQHGLFVRLDMEESDYTGLTLDIYCQMRQAGFDNLGVVIQAYLFRSRADLEMLQPLQARVRLCKGAYKEPPNLAFPSKADTDANYDALAAFLLDQAAETSLQGTPDGRFPPLAAFATHDPERISNVKRRLAERPLPAGTVEFQMLYGIRRDLQTALAAEGYPVRVYVPFGTHWYPYMMRRLAERPANLWFFVSNFFRW